MPFDPLFRMRPSDRDKLAKALAQGHRNEIVADLIQWVAKWMRADWHSSTEILAPLHWARRALPATVIEEMRRELFAIAADAGSMNAKEVMLLVQEALGKKKDAPTLH